MTASERACEAIRLEPRHEPLGAFEVRLRDSIEAQIRQGVVDALERAAQAVYDVPGEDGFAARGLSAQYDDALRVAAAAIRALKEPTP